MAEEEIEEKEIDLVELAQKLWAKRRTVIKGTCIGIIVGLVVALSIPREYTTTVQLAPEMGSSDKKMSGGLSSLASMAGISLPAGSSVDAVYPNIYPDVVSSVPFMVSLFNVEVTEKDGELTTTVYDYLDNHTHGPWWSAILSLPGKAIGAVMSIFRNDDESGEGHKTNEFRLTKDEWEIAEALGKRIGATVDTKTFAITLTAQMQDPQVSAMLADSITTKLQDYVTNYRTEKARKDLIYTQKLNDEARAEYYAAQQRYADYVDRNHNIALNSRRTEEERMRNEAQLAFNLYNSTAAQLQQAKAKVQEQTPVYAVIKPATVPNKPSSSRLTKLLTFAFLGFVISAAWAIFGDQAKDIIAQIKGK